MRFREVFPGGEKAAGHARRVLARWLADALPGDRLSDMQLLVTEIVANCVRHGHVGEDGEIDLLVNLTDGVARVEVRDTGIQADPQVRTPDLSGGGGFGMVLVERMSRAWGVDHEPKVVMWFELDLESREDGGGGPGRESAVRRPFQRRRARTRGPRRGARGRRFGPELRVRSPFTVAFGGAF
jgi:anti-sigma regulatory factor (Ser/Thr protein kinase)